MPIPPELRVTAVPVDDVEALGAEWQALEQRARFTPFQGWGWVGCLASERFDRPILFRALCGERVVGLALFNRSRGALHLSESGVAERDRPYVEHNGPLLAQDAPEGTAAALLRAALRQAGRLVLSGVPPALARAVGGTAWRWRIDAAPCIRLDMVQASPGDWLAGLSANARYQLRRSDRAYENLRVERAETAEQAGRFLEELIGLHMRRWGEAGAFATPWLRRFHAALVARLHARAELDFLRVTAADGVVGLVYNLRRDGRVFAYQSGWQEAAAHPHRKPGLTCHHAAIRLALARGDGLYDFLAGDQRYKRSLAGDSAEELVWAELARPLSLRGVAARLLGPRRG